MVKKWDLKSYEKDKDFRIHNYRQNITGGETYIQGFFEPVIKKFSKDFKILEIGSGSSDKIGYLKEKGFNYLYGVECNFARVVYGCLDYPTIPVFYGFFNSGMINTNFDIIFTYGTLFLTKKEIVKDIARVCDKYFGSYENEKIQHFNIKKEFVKNGFRCISVQDFKHENGAIWTGRWFIKEKEKWSEK